MTPVKHILAELSIIQLSKTMVNSLSNQNGIKRSLSSLGEISTSSWDDLILEDILNTTNKKSKLESSPERPTNLVVPGPVSPLTAQSNLVKQLLSFDKDYRNKTLDQILDNIKLKKSDSTSRLNSRSSNLDQLVKDSQNKNFGDEEDDFSALKPLNNRDFSYRNQDNSVQFLEDHSYKQSASSTPHKFTRFSSADLSIQSVSPAKATHMSAFSSPSQSRNLSSTHCPDLTSLTRNISSSASNKAIPIENDPIENDPIENDEGFKQPAAIKREQASVQNAKSFAQASITLLTQKQTIFQQQAAESFQPENQSSTKRIGNPDEKVEKSHQAIVLSDEQNKVIELAKRGKSIFYTGSAGTGKSLLLRSLIKTLRSQHPKGSVAVTASTGLAACNIGGMTLHSFTGIGLGQGTTKELIKKIKRQPAKKDTWRELEVLIVDEISMIDGELLDKLNEISQTLRKSSEPFGGVQLILCGDFYQLPPVSKNGKAKFAFESDTWKECIDYTIVLEKVFRQKGDTGFVEMLQEVRNADIADSTVKKFVALQRTLTNRHGVTPAHLFSTRREVEISNNKMLKELDGKEIVFDAIDGGSIKDPELRSKLLSNFLAPKRIGLKKGAQVMMVKNIDSTLVNGSLGTVIDFMDPDTYTFLNSWKNGGDVIDEEMQQIASHYQKDANHDKHLVANPNDLDSDLDDDCFDFLDEIRSKALDKAKIDKELKKSFEPVSKPNDSIEVLLEDDDSPIPVSVLKNIERKRELLNRMYASSKGRRLPLVRFIQTDGQTRDVLVEAESFNLEDEFEKPLVSRTQIPLILAWAISIHKSQGQTLPLVKVDLKRVFENGQAYVALSRAVNRRGLQVINFDKTKIKTDPKVVQFYKGLKTVDEAIKEGEMREREKSLAPGKRYFTPQIDVLEHLNDNVGNADYWMSQANRDTDREKESRNILSMLGTRRQ